MLLNLFQNGLDGQAFIELIYFIIIWFISLTIHEYSHGYIAYKLGDPTAKNFGRLTINPVKHIDPIGLLMILIIGFGWAKPVPINPRYFKNPKKGMAISAAAGPISNILLAFIGALIYAILLHLFLYINFWNSVAVSALIFFNYFAMINVWFAVFNLIPIPPLDGSRIVSYFLPPRLHYYYNYIERYGFIILILLMNVGRLERMMPFLRYINIISGIQTVSGWILSGINYPINWIFSLFGG